MRLMRNSLVIASLGLVLTTGLHAQQTNVGNITGSVQDATAAIVPGAEVLVVNTATGVAQSASTTSAGLYNINLLPVGNVVSAHVCVTIPNFHILETSYGELPWRANLIDPPEQLSNGCIVVGYKFGKEQ